MATMSDDEVGVGTNILIASNPLGEITNYETSRQGIVRYSMPTGVHQNIAVTGRKTYDDTPQSYGKVGALMALPIHPLLLLLLCGQPRFAVFQVEILQDSKARNIGLESADEVERVASIR